MSLSTLVKSTIINGANSIAVAVREGVIYRIQPVEVMREIKIHNLQANRTKAINLSGFLHQDYKIVGVTVDFEDDDNDKLPDGNRNPENLYCTCYVRIFSQNKASENLVLGLSSYPPYINKLYINHNDTWQIKVTKDVKKITFRCVPVLIDEAVNIA